jgi:hypothetical protein
MLPAPEVLAPGPAIHLPAGKEAPGVAEEGADHCTGSAGMTDSVLVHFNITEERAKELIAIARPIWEKFVRREIVDGVLFSSFVNMDELLVNEKCFLTYHCTQAAEKAIAEMRRQQRIAELLIGGGI